MSGIYQAHASSISYISQAHNHAYCRKISRLALSHILWRIYWVYLTANLRNISSLILTSKFLLSHKIILLNSFWQLRRALKKNYEIHPFYRFFGCHPLTLFPTAYPFPLCYEGGGCFSPPQLKTYLGLLIDSNFFIHTNKTMSN